MILFPAVDIKDGSAVRLKQGQADKKTVFFSNPVEAAAQWKEQGAQWLHVVDLDGAFSSKGVNLEMVKGIVRETGLSVQLGGGIRSIKDIEIRLNAGINRVIIGTAAYENPDMLGEAIKNFGEARIACGIDAKNGRVAVKGWVETEDISPLDMAARASDQGVKTIIYTDISKDGMLEGPNIEATSRLIESTGLNIIASGGISSIEDIIKCAQIGAYGTITGQAIYSGAIDLREAFKRLEEL